MRASEALMLGSTLIKPLHGTALHGDGKNVIAGCALGMMHVATNVDRTVHTQDFLERMFPWMVDRVYMPKMPCGCTFVTPCAVATAVVHIFDIHIRDAYSKTVHDEEWTIDRLAAWLDSVDPTPREQVSALAEQLSGELVNV